MRAMASALLKTVDEIRKKLAADAEGGHN